MPIPPPSLAASYAPPLRLAGWRPGAAMASGPGLPVGAVVAQVGRVARSSEPTTTRRTAYNPAFATLADLDPSREAAPHTHGNDQLPTK